MEERRALVRHCKSSDMDIELCYQTFGSPKDSAVILVGGLNMQSFAWDEGFCEALVQRGFFVIRFDNRDIGHSTKIEAGGNGGRGGSPTTPTTGALLEDCETSPSSLVPVQEAPAGGESSGPTHSGSCVVRVSGHPLVQPSPATSVKPHHHHRGPHHHHPTNDEAALFTGRCCPLWWSAKDGVGGRCRLVGQIFTGCVRSCCTAMRHGIHRSMNGGGAAEAGKLIPKKRVPKIVPWRLLLPQALACGEILPYTLEDMALDALALLDVLGVRRAHVFGISMGGMIAQHMALLAPQRVRTLTCIMSSTNAQDLPHPAWWVKLWMLRKPASNSNREQLVEFRMKALQGLLYGCVPVDEDYLKKRIALSLNRSSYADGLLRQAAAIMRAPSRDDDLRRVVRCPCLIIHGQNDVLCRVEHGYRLAKVLTNSKFVVFKNMGHYLNPAYFDTIVKEFLGLVQRGELFETEERERDATHLGRLNAVSTRYEHVV
jgi:pimeloyl-ACP methyl ester carboxylesterase